MDKSNLEYDQLQELMEDFFQLTHIRISFWSNEMEKCFMAPANGNSPFCSELRKVPALDAECRRCEKRALEMARKSGVQLCNFQCSAGLNETIYPIVYNDMILGYFMYGQVRGELTDQIGRMQREALYRKYGLDSATMETLYGQLPAGDGNMLLSAGRMMANIAFFAYVNGYISDYSTPLTEKITRYLQSQYMNLITVDSACAFLHVSRSYLSHTIQKEMNSTFLKLLNGQRVLSVCRALEEGKSIEEAAERSGFQSPGYMTRVFKNAMGLTPNEYRNRVRGDISRT